MGCECEGREGGRERGGEDAGDGSAQAGLGDDDGVAVRARHASDEAGDGGAASSAHDAGAQLEGVQQPTLRRHGQGASSVRKETCGFVVGAARPPPPRLLICLSAQPQLAPP